VRQVLKQENANRTNAARERGRRGGGGGGVEERRGVVSHVGLLADSRRGLRGLYDRLLSAHESGARRLKAMRGNHGRRTRPPLPHFSLSIPRDA